MLSESSQDYILQLDFLLSWSLSLSSSSAPSQSSSSGAWAHAFGWCLCKNMFKWGLLFTDLFCGSVLQLPYVFHTSCFHLRDRPSYLLFHQQGHSTGHRAPSPSPAPLRAPLVWWASLSPAHLPTNLSGSSAGEDSLWWHRSWDTTAAVKTFLDTQVLKKQNQDKNKKQKTRSCMLSYKATY